ncbi:hypothetical protein SLS58_003772 [Diplodia intermedia]|uniref:Fungal N-terminal domain-containing protein n=1 Tax=Diplodia intermedia TaxID=856260 RepID=A0ABR3TVB0_9PEZI
MVDPYLALAAAGNVAQFVVYAAQVISKGNEIHRSRGGALVEHEQLSVVTKDLSKLASGTKSFLETARLSSTLDADDEALLQICSGCDDVAQELLGALGRVMSQGKQGRWKSIRKALKAVWTKDEIRDIDMRLSNFRDQLTLRILLQSKHVQCYPSSVQNPEAYERLPRYKLDSTDAKHTQALDSLDAKAREVLLALANRDQQIDDHFTAQGSLIRGLHLETASTIQEEGRRINCQLTAAHTNIERFASRSENQAQQVLQSQCDLAEQIDQSNEARQTDLARLEMEVTRLQQEARQQFERMRTEIEQQIKSVEGLISKENTELKQLILSTAESIKNQDAKQRQRFIELSNAKTLAIRAKQIFVEHLKTFLDLLKLDNLPNVNDYIAQFSSLRVRLYPKPAQGQLTQPRAGAISQLGYFLASKEMTLHYPVRTGNVLMIQFFLEAGAHKHLSDSAQVEVYNLALQPLYPEFPASVPEKEKLFGTETLKQFKPS